MSLHELLERQFRDPWRHGRRFSDSLLEYVSRHLSAREVVKGFTIRPPTRERKLTTIGGKCNRRINVRNQLASRAAERGHTVEVPEPGSILIGTHKVDVIVVRRKSQAWEIDCVHELPPWAKGVCACCPPQTCWDSF